VKSVKTINKMKQADVKMQEKNTISLENCGKYNIIPEVGEYWLNRNHTAWAKLGKNVFDGEEVHTGCLQALMGMCE
jgi:hypothetical protein